MRAIIVLVFLVLAGAFLLDSFRKRGAQKKPEPVDPMLSANDAPPTETGRLRVKHIVDALKKPGDVNEGETTPIGNPDEVVKPDSSPGKSLPDPFESK